MGFSPKGATMIDELLAERKVLQERLDISASEIEKLKRQGLDVSEWERLWLEQLAMYGKLSDEIASLHARQLTTWVA